MRKTNFCNKIKIELFGFISLFTILIGIVSCGNEDPIDVVTVTPVPTATAFNTIRQTALTSLTQHFTFTANSGSVTFTSANGVTITINSNCLLENGIAVTSGNINLKYIEMFSGGNMLVGNKTTMGIDANNNKAMLISGGEFYVNATKNGQLLTTSCPFQLTVPANLTESGGNANMKLWNGTEDTQGNIVWNKVEQNPNGAAGGVFLEGQGPGANYSCIISNFGWTNVDRFYSDPNPKTTILSAVPSGYTNQNAAIYLHYDGLGNGLAQLDTYNAITGLFSEHYGQIPIGLPCHIIFISESSGQWKYAIKGITISANAVYTFTTGELLTGTQAQVVTAINGLP